MDNMDFDETISKLGTWKGVTCNKCGSNFGYMLSPFETSRKAIKERYETDGCPVCGHVNERIQKVGKWSGCFE